MPSLQSLAVGLMALGGFVAALNWLYLFQTWYTGRFHSPIPLIGGLFLCVGMLLLSATRPYAWTVVFIDYGTAVSLLGLPYLVGELWRNSRFNLLEEYTGQLDNKTVHLRLFRRGVFTLNQHFRREPGGYGGLGIGTIGEWERERGKLLLRRGEQSAVLESSLDGESASLRLTNDFADYEGREWSLAGIVLRRTYRKPS